MISDFVPRFHSRYVKSDLGRRIPSIVIYNREYFLGVLMFIFEIALLEDGHQLPTPGAAAVTVKAEKKFRN
jgi:hypothetical protein